MSLVSPEYKSNDTGFTGVAMKSRNLIFAVIVCIFLLGPFGVFVIGSGGVDLPSWLTAEDSAYLTGGLVETNIEESLNLDGYASKTLQSALENKIGNNIPVKAQVIYMNGALQRQCIEASNALFNWESYPAFFGSAYCYIPRQDRILPIPQRMTQETEQAFQNYIKHLDEFSKAHPDIDFVTYFAPGWDTALYSPLNDLTCESISYAKVQEIVDSALEDKGGSTNSKYLFAQYNGDQDEAKYLADYYRFDHHWNNRGAARAYYQIAESLNLPQRDAGYCFDIAGEPYSGAYARSASMNVAEPFVGVSNGLDSTIVDYRNHEWIMGEHVRYFDAGSLERHYNAYTLYSETLEGATIKTGNGDKNVLLLSDSYGGALQYFLPLSCNSLVQGISLSMGDTSSDTLEQILANCDADIDAVVFVAHSSNISGLSRRKPDFFAFE
ncbi:hypothetical protein [Anaerotardibacter muris]|uniref:hypothetical protein n=1 Tax=Anaerotardibacter muris TaxID=2941505 RepID=UPI002040C2FF|nr:hypothetical protein [Anaerotardibacter muris]